MTGDDLAAWTLSLAWAEHQCCVSVGRWSVAATVDGVTAALGPVSAHHGWRAEQWRELWPARRGGLDGAAADPQAAQHGHIEKQVREIVVGHDRSIERDDEHLIPKVRNIAEDFAEISETGHWSIVIRHWSFVIIQSCCGTSLY